MVAKVMNSERMNESVDSKVGVTGRLLKAEYKRLSLEQEQARRGDLSYMRYNGKNMIEYASIFNNCILRNRFYIYNIIYNGMRSSRNI